MLFGKLFSVSSVILTTGLSLQLVSAQVYTSCSDTKAGECAAAPSYRTCQGVDGVETCGACLDGYIQKFHRKTKEVPVNPNDCFSIDSITSLDEYRAVHEAVIVDDTRSDADHLQNLIDTARLISAHNSQSPQPPQYFLDINHLSLLTEADMGVINGHRSDNFAEEAKFDFHPGLETGNRKLQTPPSSVNWVTRGAVTPVKNQGQCGCCWTISTVGAIEGIAAIQSNYTFLESLSFQQLISCDTANNQQGCNGGNVINAMSYSEGNAGNTLGGMTDYSQYPFTDIGGKTSTACLLSQKNDSLVVAVRNTGFYLKSSSPSSYASRVSNMKSALVNQPVSILMNARCTHFQSYSHGILTTDQPGCQCGPGLPGCIDHAILMVGYDDTGSTPYWLIKNSWAATWGEQGYFRVAQSPSASGNWGLFGVLSQGSAPLFASNNTAAVPQTSGSMSIVGVTSSAFISTIAMMATSLLASVVSFSG